MMPQISTIPAAGVGSVQQPSVPINPALPVKSDILQPVTTLPHMTPGIQPNQIMVIDPARMANEKSSWIQMGNLQFKISGTDTQVLEIALLPGQGISAEPGAMVYKDNFVQMNTKMGGLLSGIKRAVSGENFFVTQFDNKGQYPQCLGLTAAYPGTIVPLDLKKENGSFLCQRGAFLCGEKDTVVSVAFTRRIGAAFFGKEGFVLQKLSGNGMAFIHGGGSIIKRELQPGETIQVDTGCLVGFSNTVNYDIQLTGGVSNTLFGGEGVFLAKMTGPGTVYIQSMPYSKLTHTIAHSLQKNRSSGFFSFLSNSQN